MDELTKALAAADDEYLTGISNKGILKRAYKDLESAVIQPGFISDTADVMVDNAHCTIVSPIVQSVCSCPSRSVCRHIVTAVLWLKREFLPQELTSAQSSQEKKPKRNLLEAELSEVDLDTIKKAMKKKYYNAFIEKAKTGILPFLDEGSTITAEIYEENVTVKLLSPLDYSACTCKSSKLCCHKAAAILAWKLKHGQLSQEKLVPVEDAVTVSADRVHDSAEYCFKFLSRVLSDGLVRTPEDAAEYAESGALLCHNAGFPEGERMMREIGKRLKFYVTHNPQFRAETLFSQIMGFCSLMRSIIAEDDPKKLSELTGEFKSDYHIADDLELIPMTRRDFSSVSGYAGKIYYFVNKSKSGSELPFLTFSDVRPTIYNVSRTNATNAPWGLGGRCNVLMNYELRLMMPKLSGIKLSSSHDTHAEPICKPDLDQKAVYDKIYTDFYKLIDDNFNRKKDDREILVMFMPSSCVSSVFSEKEQTQTMIVEDYYGQRIRVRVRYTSGTKDFFSRFVQVGEIMMAHPERHYVLFGNACIEDGECVINPIDIFDKINIPIPEITQRDSYSTGLKPFLRLFNDISDSLCDMIQCGINSYDLTSHLSDAADECEVKGLNALSDKLKKLSDALSARKHSLSADNSFIISLLIDIYDYIGHGKRLVEVGCAVDDLSLCGRKNN